jgi:hypothetical protein
LAFRFQPFDWIPIVPVTNADSAIASRPFRLRGCCTSERLETALRRGNIAQILRPEPLKVKRGSAGFSFALEPTGSAQLLNAREFVLIDRDKACSYFSRRKSRSETVSIIVELWNRSPLHETCVPECRKSQRVCIDRPVHHRSPARQLIRDFRQVRVAFTVLYFGAEAYITTMDY